ncbi:MAG: hypothetical protein HW400_188 [Candidatus Levybacteria bacterium]|nr:hypothetical protein [Candidatus Levybacteria bacterium]
MTRKLLVLLFPLLLLVFASGANAETSTSGIIPTTSALNTQNATDAATKLKVQMRQLEEQKKTAVSKIKEDAKVMIQAKRDEFKAKLQTIKDLRKKTLVERIDAKLAEVNKNHTTRFTEILVRLQGFLDKIKQSPTATNSTVLADITAVQTAIDTAKTAVDTQAAKAYTIGITDETSLKINVGATVSQLRLDLMAVYKLVIDAKQAVQKLHSEKPKLEKEATSSAKE